jgi:Arc/MetJ family transcription regulator
VDYVRTNIEIDDKLMKRVMREYGFETKRSAVEAGLQTLLKIKAQTRILELRGKVKWDGNLEESRLGRFSD